MKSRIFKLFSSPLVALCLALLLVLLAGLQYHWTGQVSRAEHDRMRKFLDGAARRLQGDFDAEVMRLFLFFRSPGRDYETLRKSQVVNYSSWIDQAPMPDLLEDVFLLRRSEDSFQLERLNSQGTDFETTAWPQALRPLHDSLASQAGQSSRPTFAPLIRAAGQVPALLIPARLLARGRGWESLSSDLRLTVLQLDSVYLGREFLPKLALRHFGDPDASDYLIRIRSASGEELFSHGASQIARSSQGAPDTTLPIFSLFPRLRGGSDGPGNSQRQPRRRGRRGPPSGTFPGDPARPGPLGPAGLWTLEITHREGSLDAAVSRLRRRNLVLGLGILSLLGGALAMMFATTRRANELARQRLEFVAGVSHELRTPLSAIRSASENLTDGIVTDQGRIRQYGRLIQEQSQRLSEMVQQVLAFAGLEADMPGPALQAVDVAALAREVLEDLSADLGKRGIDVECHFHPETPRVAGQEGMLRRVLHNLLSNAAKHGGSGGWIGVRLGPSQDGRWVELEVADKGPGLRPEERDRLFEPFFRGREAVRGQIPGSGLGLSLVQRFVAAQDGTLEVQSAAGEGTAFRVRLPTQPPPGTMAESIPEAAR